MTTLIASALPAISRQAGRIKIVLSIGATPPASITSQILPAVVVFDGVGRESVGLIVQ